jgi:hypothetical protein
MTPDPLLTLSFSSLWGLCDSYSLNRVGESLSLWDYRLDLLPPQLPSHTHTLPVLKTVYKLGTVMHTCNPSTPEVEAGGSRV